MRYSKAAVANYKWLRLYKSKHPCTKCKEDDYRCLEFHHLKRSTKSFNIADAAKRGYSKAKIMSEIKKCVVLCCNCHRRTTIKAFKD